MRRVILWAIGLGCVALIVAALLLPAGQSAREAAFRSGKKTDFTNLAGFATHTAGETERAAPATGDKLHTGEPAGLNRKIVYSASLELVVEDFAGVPEKVAALVKKYEGYVASSNLAGATGETRRGTWKVRVPVARFESFVGAAKGLGELISAGTSSSDVSEEYYDVEARIRNKTKEEERLLKLLEERPGKLEDVVAIERELSRVREELERMQGRMRVLADLTSLTTADLTITEIRDYKPEDAPTLSTRARRTFDSSFAALKTTGGNLLIAAVAAVPWLPVAAIALVLGYGAVRTGRRRLGPSAKKTE